MSGSNNSDTTPPNEASSRARRGSFTPQTFTSIFGATNNRSGSTSGPTPPFPSPIATAAAQDQRRRMSLSTLGLSGTSPSQQSLFPFGGRRGSVSTSNSEAIDENAVDDDEGPGRSNPTAPFSRRMSYGAQVLRTVRGGGSPGTTGDGGGFNWPEQLRTRAESSVSQTQRPNLSASPPAKPMQMHERAKSVSEMPAPPTAVPTAPAPRPERKKPDAFQERILKGDFYMD